MDKYETMALQIQNARKKIHTTFLNRDQSSAAYQAWVEACSEFNKIYHRLHASYQLYPNETQLKQGDANAIQIALNYLSADVYYFTSGYNKEFITIILKRLLLADNNLLSTQQLSQLESVLLKQVTSCHGREFRYYCRLAKVLSSSTLRIQLEELVKSSEPQISRRARWMLGYLG